MKNKERLLLYLALSLFALGTLLRGIGEVQGTPSPARRPNNFNSNTVVSPPSDVEDVDLSTTDWTPTQGSTNARQIYVGTAGDVKVTLIDGGTVTYHNWAAGASKSMLVTRIWKTGTTATQLEAEY